ncbi:MAG TPA: DUF3093 domain-containing protein [Mycobacterium sp.]|jgi:hypothetical protein
MTEPLFYEPGASWYWLLAGPLAAAAMLWIEVSSGLGPQPVVPAFFLVLVSGFLAVQVKAARTHTSVELTHETLRQGTETIDVAHIVRIFPEPDPDDDPPKWRSARALGELTGVPKGRTGIGLKLTEGRTAQAWARKHQELRIALTDLIEQRTSP